MYVITMICWRAIKYLFLSVLWVSSHKLQYSRCKKCIYSNYHLGLSTRSFSSVNLLWESHECNKIVLTDIHKIWLWCLKVTFRSSTQKVNLLIIFFFFLQTVPWSRPVWPREKTAQNVHASTPWEGKKSGLSQDLPLTSRVMCTETVPSDLCGQLQLDSMDGFWYILCQFTFLLHLPIHKVNKNRENLIIPNTKLMDKDWHFWWSFNKKERDGILYHITSSGAEESSNMQQALKGSVLCLLRQL